MESEKTSRFTVEIDKSMHTNLKILCAGLKISMKDVVEKALKKEIELMQRKLYER